MLFADYANIVRKISVREDKVAKRPERSFHLVKNLIPRFELPRIQSDQFPEVAVVQNMPDGGMLYCRTPSRSCTGRMA